jgi:hypothetical protein
LIHRSRRDAPGDLLVFEPYRPVEHDDDEPSLARNVVRDHIRRHVAHPGSCGRVGRPFREGDRRERDDRPRFAVFQDDEVRRRQPLHRKTAPIQHRNVHLHDVDAGSERLPHRLLRGGKHAQDAGHRGNDRRAHRQILAGN